MQTKPNCQEGTFALSLDFCRSFCYSVDGSFFGLGAARTAGGWLHHPKGGEAHANYFTYRSLHGDDHRKTQKPPLWQVTVSSL